MTRGRGGSGAEVSVNLILRYHSTVFSTIIQENDVLKIVNTRLRYP